MAFGSKNSTPSFVLTLPMVIGLNEQDYLNKEFKKCGIIYNQLVNATTKMWHQLRKTRKYRELMAAIAKAAPDSDEQKALFKQREKMLKEYRFSEDAFHAMVVPYAKHYAINSHVAQSIATAVWTAWSSFFFDKGKGVHYKFDHTDESYTKKKLSERMARLRSGDIVQRDLYSAFLLEHIDTESLQYNMETLNSAFPAFLEMHENTKRRLQAVGSSLPASIGF